MPAASAIRRNLVLYPWYAVCFHAHFWMPVFFLYFSDRFSLDRVLVLEAVYYAAVVLLEVPSGYLSDRIGRRTTLLVAATTSAAAFGLFFLGAGFAAFAAAQVLLAAGKAFNSGTDVSFHYDSLEALGRTEEFARREAVVARNVFLGTAVAALIGGAVATIALRHAYGLSLVTTLTAIFILLACVEPHVDTDQAERTLGRQVRACLRLLRHPALAWLFAFAVLMTIINHVPYEFYQPYLALLGDEGMLPSSSTPALAGMHMAITMVLGAFFAHHSVRWSDRVGIGPVLLGATALQVLQMGIMALVLHPLVAALVLLRSTPRALMTAPLNAAIAPRVEASRRATYFSLQSLVGRLAFSGFLLGMSTLTGNDGLLDWPSISRMSWLGAALGGVGLLLLAGTMRSCLGRVDGD